MVGCPRPFVRSALVPPVDVSPVISLDTFFVEFGENVLFTFFASETIDDSASTLAGVTFYYNGIPADSFSWDVIAVDPYHAYWRLAPGYPPSPPPVTARVVYDGTPGGLVDLFGNTFQPFDFSYEF